ncbi:MAG: aminotransferase class V-fold PLP-dependent enzyme [Salinivenus sp.]
MTLETLRSCFPHLDHHTYLNHAAVSPISTRVRDAIDEYLAERHGAQRDAPIANFESFQPVMQRAKERAAQVLGAGAAQVEFVPNTSAGLNLLTRGLDWSDGDRVAVPDGSFPTNVYPFQNLEAEGVSVDFVPTDEGAYTLSAIEDTLRPETRVLSISWVHFLSGFRADLDAIGALCEANDVLFCVDAIQGLGALRLDVEAARIDFLAAGGHKWLMATQGAGLVYCRDALRDRLRPPTGWLHGPVDWDNLGRYDLTFHDDARRFRTGTLNAIGVVALDAALGLHLEAGPEWCEDRLLKLAEALGDALDARGYRRYGRRDPAHASGIVTVAPTAPEALYEHLQGHGVTAALRNRKVRFAPSYYNNEADLEAALDAVDAFDPTPMQP